MTVAEKPRVSHNGMMDKTLFNPSMIYSKSNYRMFKYAPLAYRYGQPIRVSDLKTLMFIMKVYADNRHDALLDLDVDDFDFLDSISTDDDMTTMHIDMNALSEIVHGRGNCVSRVKENMLRLEQFRMVLLDKPRGREVGSMSLVLGHHFDYDTKVLTIQLRKSWIKQMVKAGAFVQYNLDHALSFDKLDFRLNLVMQTKRYPLPRRKNKYGYAQYVDHHELIEALGLEKEEASFKAAAMIRQSFINIGQARHLNSKNKWERTSTKKEGKNV